MSKYIIDVGEAYVKYDVRGESDMLCLPVRINEFEDNWLNTNIPLTPYTELDLEQVRKEAYDRGYADAKCGYENGFENGMIVAWDAAKKIALMDTETSENVTGYFGLFRIMENLTPMQAIEKIRQYEQEQEEIKVGDEVHAPFGTAVVTNIVDDKIWFCYADGHCGFDYKKDKPLQTGRHFPEIAAVLEKMRGEQDG